MPVTVLSAVRAPVRHVRDRLHRMAERFATLLRVTRILVDRLLHRSDFGRWSNPYSLETWWDARTKQLACLVPHGSRVLEFGAGCRQLEQYLPPGCSYVPSDLVDRGPGTIVCDLNSRPLPDLHEIAADVGVFGGVLEYVRDLPSFLQWLAGQVSFCVASYAYVTPTTTWLQGILERWDRANYGYLNSYTEEGFVALFEHAGFRCTVKDTWENQRLFLFVKRQRVGAKSGPGTVVCDLNRRPLPDLRHLQLDVAVFSGVLEYISDLPSLLRWLSTQVSFCVSSYSYVESWPRTIRRCVEVLRRACTGRMNPYTAEELVALFRHSGFVPIMEQDTFDSQRLFLFGKSTEGVGS
jgi:hypothetical protein